MNIYRYVLISLLSLCCASGASAQLLDSAALADLKPYESIQEAVANPDSVIKLVLRKQKLKEFPAEILKFKNLQYLDLSRNKISQLPAGIGSLENLQALILSQNSLEELPSEIGTLKNLKHLSVNRNELSSLPTRIGELENLEVLDLWSNNLVIFPEEMKKLEKLKFLDLRAILLNKEDQEKISALLPNTNIQFDAYCNCKY